MLLFILSLSETSFKRSIILINQLKHIVLYNKRILALQTLHALLHQLGSITYLQLSIPESIDIHAYYLLKCHFECQYAIPKLTQP